MASYKSIFPMMILIILSFLTPTRQANNDKEKKDLRTCFHTLAANCGNSYTLAERHGDVYSFPLAEKCISMAFYFWDEETFSGVDDVMVQGILTEYYLSFAANIDRTRILGPDAYCNYVVIGEVNKQICRNQLEEFKNLSDGSNDPSELDEVTLVIFDNNPDNFEYVNYGDEALRAVKFGLYKTKLSKYVNLPNANAYNIDVLFSREQVVTSNTMPNFHSTSYMYFLAANIEIKNHAIKNPMEYCIEKILPEIAGRLSVYNNAIQFFFGD